jgi:hypothetical protein
VATSKAKKNKQNRSRKTSVAKAHRRAGRKVKNPEFQDLRGAVIEVPIWEYPREAAMMAEQDPRLTYEELLTVLLAHPAYVSINSAPPGTMVPAKKIQETGTTVEEFIGSLAEMHRLGVMKWDPITHIHHMTSDFEAQILSSGIAVTAPR